MNSDHGRLRSPQTLWAAAMVSAVTGLYSRFFAQLQSLPVGDIADTKYYHFAHLAARYRAGELPLWAPHYYAGHPFFGNMLSILYPGDFLFVVFPIPLAFILDRWVHLLLGGIAMYVLARRLGLACLGGFVAAVLYTCSGNIWEHVRWGHVHLVRTTMWFPAVLLAWLVAWDAGRLGRAVACTALAAGCMYLSGHPQIFTYGTLAWGLCALTLAAQEGRTKIGLTARRLGLTALAGGLGVLIAAVHLLPLAELTQYTGRGTPDAMRAEALAWSPLGWLLTLWPRLFVLQTPAGPPRLISTEEGAAYVGALALCLGAIGLCSRAWRGRTLAVITLGFGVCYALGPRTPLQGWVTALLPPLAQFRAPERFLFVALWGFALVAGRGADMVAGATIRPRRAGLVVLGACVLVVWGGVVALHGPLYSGRVLHGDAMLESSPLPLTAWTSPALLMPLVSLGLAAALCVLLVTWRRHSWSAPVLGIALLCNLWLGYTRNSPTPTVRLPAESELDGPTTTTPLGRVFVPRKRAGAMSSLLRDERDIDGSGPFMLATLERYMSRVADVGRLRNVAYELHPRAAECATVARYTLLDVERAVCREDGKMRVLTLDHTHAWFVRTVQRVPDADAALDAVTDPAFDPATTAVLLAADVPPIPPAPASSDRATVTLLVAENHTQIWQVNTGAVGVFVISELAYPGWRVYVNEEPQPALRANYLLRGVALSPGTWTVAWRYEPRSLRIGGALSCLGLLTVIVLGVRHVQAHAP